MTFGLRVSSLAGAVAEATDWATHAVSLLDPGEGAVPVLAARHLVLRFEDRERDGPDAPGREAVAAVLAFTADLVPTDRLLVHCVAGLSRSTALATAILVQHGVPADAALARVAEMRPDLWPNERICRFADAWLASGGAIMAAVRRWQAAEIARFEHDERPGPV